MTNDGVCPLLSSMMTRPDGNAVIVTKLQKLVSSRDVRSNDGRFSIHRDTRTSHTDCVIRLDARRLLVYVPSRPELHRDCFLLSLQHYINPIASSICRRGSFDGQHFAPDRFNRFRVVIVLSESVRDSQQSDCKGDHRHHSCYRFHHSVSFLFLGQCSPGLLKANASSRTCQPSHQFVPRSANVSVRRHLNLITDPALHVSM